MAKSKNNIWQQYIAIAISVIAVIGFGYWYWYSQSYIKPENVFWGTIDRNLQTGFVTKTNTTTDGQQTLTQVTNLQFKSQLASHTFVSITGETEANKGYIATETIGTPTKDYLKYSAIVSSSAQPNNKAVGVWALNIAGQNQEVQILSSEILSTPVIFGYLNHAQRSELINVMRQNKVFDIDFSAVNTLAKFAGQKAYTYKININLPGYVPVYKAYLKMLGQNQLADQIAPPDADSTLPVTMTINPANRQLKQLIIGEAPQGDTFSNYDVNESIILPKDAKMSINELQSLLLN